ncbi:MAG: UDP-N-acetylmuramate dehydrogenase [Simkaniaceae bacterium]|nr:UDP-N-acetylmuramate dehydrogenase [Simkaniaceae bacterium]
MLVKENEPLARYTTFGIGGAARYFVAVRNSDEALEALSYGKEMPIHILGKGSNTLFDDRGFPGLVILNQILHKKLDGNLLTVGSGYNFSQLGAQMSRAGMSGLEFASGIPATVGGAVFMNAGAGGKEVCDVIEEVTFVDESVHLFSRDELNFSYRHSPFHELKGMITEARFRLTPSAEAKITQKKILDYRLATQPYGDKTAGCCFRNPEGESASRLIDQCGLKGVTVGGAQVSEKHANFIVNKNGATAKDVLGLMDAVKTRVYEETGITLKEEVRYIPYEFSS